MNIYINIYLFNIDAIMNLNFHQKKKKKKKLNNLKYCL